MAKYRVRHVVAVAALLIAAATPVAAKTFRLGMPTLPSNRGNPYYTTSSSAATFFSALYDALTVIDNSGTVRPALALDWHAENETTWIFHLRPGVQFSNGEPFDAAAVKAVFDFFHAPGAVGGSIAREVDIITAARVIDPLTVAITTASPNILLPRYIAAVPMVAPKQFARSSAEGYSAIPAGTGPFKVERWDPEKVTFSAHAQSWQRPKADTLEIIAIPEPGARIDALETGAVDVALNLNPEQLPRLRDAKLKTAQRNPTRVQSLTFNSLKPDSPFRDARVRQAINYAVNRDAIAQNLLGGLVTPASQPATAAASGFDPTLKPYPYDPAKAKALLAEAGYPKGFRFSAELPNGNGANDGAITQQIVADLAQVGVQMEARTILLPQLIKNINQGSWKGMAFQVDFSTTPSLDVLRAIRLHSCSGVAPWYCDKTIEPVIAEANHTFNAERRIALTQKIMRHYRDEAQSLFLFPVLLLDGLGPRVTGWDPWNDNLRYDLMDVRG